MNPSNGCPFQAKQTSTSESANFKPYYQPELHAALEQKRRHEPVFWCEEIGYWVLTKYQDVHAVLHDGKRFSAQNTTRPVTPMHPDAVAILKKGGYAPTGGHSSLDGEAHKRIKGVTSQVLNLGQFIKLESHIRKLVTQAMDQIDGNSKVDLLRDVNYELPALVIFKYLGIPSSDLPNVKKWAGKRSLIDFSPVTYQQQIEGAKNLVAYWQYCTEFVYDRLKNPKDDFTSRILEIRGGDDKVLSIGEAINLTFGVAFAGHETTTNQLTNTFRTLLQHPKQWQALASDPSLAANAVEEGMRFAGAVIGWRRIALVDVVFHGVNIPAGSPVMLSFASANRDEAMFENPNAFDIRRKNARRQLTFGNGVHFCLGAPLARMEMKIVLEEFSKRFPKMRLANPDQLEHMHTFIFRAPSALPVELQ